MSLPKLASSPPLSSSPSKQSVRRPSSRPHSIIDRPATATANDIPDDHYQNYHDGIANIASRLTEAEEESRERHHDSPSASQPLFQPFFTLIEDAHTSEYHHPTVHYIFSDDDTDIITEAALRSLEAEPDNFPNANGKTKPQNQQQQQPPHEIGDGEETYEGDTAPHKESLLPDPVPGVRDNYIILDLDSVNADHVHGAASSPESQGQMPQPDPENQHLDPYKFTVTSAHSLSPSWQVLNTQLLPAPTFENNSSGQKPVNGGLMLQIQGTAGLPVGLVGKDRERGSQRLEDMMDQFGKRLGELRQVIESGERGMSSEVERPLQDAGPLDGPGTQDPLYVPDEAGAAAHDVHGEDETIAKEEQQTQANPQ